MSNIIVNNQSLKLIKYFDVIYCIMEIIILIKFEVGVQHFEPLHLAINGNNWASSQIIILLLPDDLNDYVQMKQPILYLRIQGQAFLVLFL